MLRALLLFVLLPVLYFCIYGQHVENSPLFSFIYSFHMPLFFFLSGLAVSIKARKLGGDAISNFGKRFLQFIMPMLLIGGVLTLIYSNDVWHFLYTDMKYGYWYLWVLFFYLLLVRFCEVVFFNVRIGGNVM